MCSYNMELFSQCYLMAFHIKSMLITECYIRLDACKAKVRTIHLKPNHRARVIALKEMPEI